MPTDHARGTVEVGAPRGRVLTALRDVEAQPEWVREVVSAQVLTRNDDGTPATATFKASTPLGTDEYTLAYQHPDDGMSWTLLEGRQQTAQDGRYTVDPVGRNRTRVTLELTISHRFRAPGFIRRRVINGLVKGTLDGLDAYLLPGVRD
jgi:uncharacterized membrane protein